MRDTKACKPRKNSPQRNAAAERGGPSPAYSQWIVYAVAMFVCAVISGLFVAKRYLDSPLPNEPAAGNVKSKRCATKGETAAKQKLRDAATREQAVRNAEEKVHRQTAEAQADAAACDVCLDAPKTHLLQPCGHYTASATTACAEAVFADHELALSCVPRSVPQRAACFRDTGR